MADVPVVQARRWSRRAENCGVPQFQFSDKVVDMTVVVQFFDKVVDDPVVLCDGVPQVQFIDGFDVPVIMQRRYVATVKVPQIQFIAGVSGHSSLATGVRTVQTVQLSARVPR